MKKIAMILLFIISCLVIKEVGFAQSAEYPNASILVTVNELEEVLEEESAILLDVRKKGYSGGHIPGAIDFDMELIIDKQHPIEGHLVQKEVFEKVMREHGVSNDQTVVIYDQGGDTLATRLFYALEYFGHERVKVIDGGFEAWEKAKKKMDTLTSDYNRGDFKATEVKQLMMVKEEVKEVIGEENIVLLDVRSQEEYEGKDVRAKRGGHIPTAVNLEWTKVLTDNDVPVFKSAEEIRTLLEAIGATKDKKIVVYCQRANRASHMYFTLRLLGYGNLSVYEGSWEEWGNDLKTPISDPSKSERDLRSL